MQPILLNIAISVGSIATPAPASRLSDWYCRQSVWFSPIPQLSL